MTKRSLFISFEGIDGCGKSTQIEHASRFLEAKKIDHIVTQEPGGTLLGSHIRKILLDPSFDMIAPRTELFLFLASRAQHVDEVVMPALLNNKIVITDRFSDSTFAYQACVRGISKSQVATLNAFATDGLIPDITFLIDLPVSDSMERLKQSPKHKSELRFDSESMAFHQKVRDAFLSLATAEKKRFIVIDGTQKKEVISKIIITHILTAYKSHGRFA